MLLLTNKVTANTSPIENCCLERLDKRFVIVVQFALAILSLNLLAAFPLVHFAAVISLLLAGAFMPSGHIWAYALAKLSAMAFLIMYGFDIVAHIPRVTLPAFSSEPMTAKLVLGELLGIWLSGMLLTNLHKVPLQALLQNNP